MNLNAKYSLKNRFLGMNGVNEWASLLDCFLYAYKTRVSYKRTSEENLLAYQSLLGRLIRLGFKVDNVGLVKSYNTSYLLVVFLFYDVRDLGEDLSTLISAFNTCVERLCRKHAYIGDDLAEMFYTRMRHSPNMKYLTGENRNALTNLIVGSNRGVLFQPLRLDVLCRGVYPLCSLRVKAVNTTTTATNKCGWSLPAKITWFLNYEPDLSENYLLFLKLVFQ